MIKKCNCRHEFQDEKYGKGNRVYNKLLPERGKPQEYRCTVCGNVKT